MYGSDDETSSLLPRPGWNILSSKAAKNKEDEEGRRKKKPNKTQKDILWNRILIVVVLACLAAVSVVYQLEVNHLSTALQQEKSHIEDLDQQLQVHQSVIERFNMSITNSDVVDKLKSLEHDLKSTKSKLENDLARAQRDISNQLNQTLAELSETVQDAENEIGASVEQVKKDVEQYVITTQDQFSMENSFMVYQLAGTFTLLSCLIRYENVTECFLNGSRSD